MATPVPLLLLAVASLACLSAITADATAHNVTHRKLSGTCTRGGRCASDGAGCICPSGQCCSKFGYCGITANHCGTGCQQDFGSCTASPNPSPSPSPSSPRPTPSPSPEGPAGSFDKSSLSGFTIQLPVKCADVSACKASTSPNAIVDLIAPFQLSPWFYYKDNVLVLRANTDGVTSKGSEYARSELRHKLDWKLLAVEYATLAVTMRVDNLPLATGGVSTPSAVFKSPPFSRPGAICIGQIKVDEGAGNTIALQYEGQPGYVYLRDLMTSSKEFRLLRDTAGNPTKIKNGESFRFTMEVHTGKRLISATLEHNGITYTASLTASAAILATNPTVYFKTGAYLQAGTVADADRKGTGYGQLSLFNVKADIEML